MQRTVLIFLVGIFTGFFTSVFALNLHEFLSVLHHISFYELNIFSIVFSCLAVCLFSSYLYSKLYYNVSRPRFWFSMIVLSICLIDCVFMLLYFPIPGFVKLANPIHLLVGFAVVFFTPLLHNLFKNKYTN